MASSDTLQARVLTLSAQAQQQDRNASHGAAGKLQASTWPATPLKTTLCAAAGGHLRPYALAIPRVRC